MENTATLSKPATGCRLSNPTQPHFVGLAALRSLLTHEDIAASPERMDAVLDMISALLKDDSCRRVVQSFCRVRQACEPVCYLQLFRLRRWLEKEIVVRANGHEWLDLNLAFSDYRRIVQHYQRHAWEWDEECTASRWQDIPILFDWAEHAHAVQAAEMAAAVCA